MKQVGPSRYSRISNRSVIITDSRLRVFLFCIPTYLAFNIHLHCLLSCGYSPPERVDLLFIYDKDSGFKLNCLRYKDHAWVKYVVIAKCVIEHRN
jgi:hypothetical protein